MKEKLKKIVMYAGLVAIWLLPLLCGTLSFDVEFIKMAAAYLIFLAAAVLCRLLPNIHAALISAVVLGAGLCVLWRPAAYDIAPGLLLCCWLRCYMAYEKGNRGRVYFELFTDLIYAYLAAVVIRLIRSGYSFVEIRSTDTQSVPDLCLMALVFLLFSFLFLFGEKSRFLRVSSLKEKQKKKGVAELRFVGVIPVVISLRTFWGLCVLLLAASVVQYTNGGLTEETFLFFRTGFRLLFFPWMVLLFLVLDAFLAKTVLYKRFFRA